MKFFMKIEIEGIEEYKSQEELIGVLDWETTPSAKFRATDKTTPI